jgi:rhodanese-related sulfurtransferase
MRKLLAQILILLLLGVAVGAVNNLLAGKTRRLAWVGSYPDRGESTCLEEIPEEPPAEDPSSGDPSGNEAPDPASNPIPERDPGLPYAAIDSPLAYRLYQEGAVFVDARRTHQYEAGHIAGAFLLPVWESGVEEKAMELGFEVDGDLERPVVVYCTGGDCEDSHVLAEILWEKGYRSLLLYRDGLPDWQRRGWPVRKGLEQ